MRINSLTHAFLAASLVARLVPASAQSLADVARQEEERRKTITQPSKLLTNKDLPEVPPPSADASTPAPADAADTAHKDASDAETKTGTKNEKAADGKDAKDTKDAKDAEPVKDQAYWSAGQKTLQAQLDRDQVLLEALQSRINALTTDFVNRDDPAQRATISSDRQKAIEESERLKQAIQNDKKALADFQEDARRASVPPGWLR